MTITDQQAGHGRQAAITAVYRLMRHEGSHQKLCHDVLTRHARPNPVPQQQILVDLILAISRYAVAQISLIHLLRL